MQNQSFLESPLQTPILGSVFKEFFEFSESPPPLSSKNSEKGGGIERVIPRSEVSIFQQPAPHVSRSDTVIFSKAGASRLNNAYGDMYFLKSRRLAPEFLLRWFQLFPKPSLSISKAGLPFLKSWRHMSQKAVLSIFQSRHFTPKFRLQCFQFFLKPALRTSKPGVSIFQKPVHASQKTPP